MSSPILLVPKRGAVDLGPIPPGRRMTTIDAQVVRAAPKVVAHLAADVERWPALLPHYRYVRFREHAEDGGGIVEMSAHRLFGPLRWPTWWLSEMQILSDPPEIRFRHIGGITSGMDVVWEFLPHENGSFVRIVHVWDGPRWLGMIPPLQGWIATQLIGPVFIHAIASRTLAGIAAEAERRAGRKSSSRRSSGEQ